MIQGYQGSLDFFFLSEDKYDSWYKALCKVGIQNDISNFYEQCQLIGKGSFAKVMIGKNKLTKKDFAIKAIIKERVLKNFISLVKDEIECIEK